MFQILLVDDERSVVDAIAHTIPWAELDIEEVFCAYSAKEALAVVEQQHVDIVLTDIRMPGMDGLELIEAIRTYSNRIRFILLTGHAEFEYAQQALKMHVADFLLKPVRDEMLIQSIRKLTAEMREEWTRLTSEINAMNYLQHHLPTLRSDLLRNTLEGRMLPSELEAKLAMLSLPYDERTQVYPLVIRIERTEQAPMDESLLEYSILNIVEEVAGSQYVIWNCKDTHDFLVLVLKRKSPNGSTASRDDLSRMFGQLQHLVLHYLKTNISIVYGKCTNFPRDLVQVYETCLRTLRRRIGTDEGLLLTAGQSDKTVSPSLVATLQSPPTLSQLFAAGFWRDAEAKLENVFEELLEKSRDSSIPADYLYEIYHTVVAACFHYAHSNGRTITDVLDSGEDGSVLDRPERLQSIPALKAWAYDICERLSRNNRLEIQDDRDALIQHIQEYIHRHLAEDVSLQTLASSVDMHPVYLSKIYKLATGEGFKDYLYRVRMERAIQLLTNKELKVYEIAEQVGYLNTAYFIKVFKKEYGLTPQEYRERSSAPIVT